ncbi:MAG: hypothetical protein H0V12_02745 [Chloroflexi bacterium]|nr:hypothetical protein [Chloroflexota bacterium]
MAFADSLRLELRGSGATVGQLYFGAVDTEHFRTSMAHPLMERAQRRIPKTFVQPASVEDAAAAIQRAIERRSRRAVFPRSKRPPAVGAADHAADGGASDLELIAGIGRGPT